jgi:hypothetical protein
VAPQEVPPAAPPAARGPLAPRPRAKKATPAASEAEAESEPAAPEAAESPAPTAPSATFTIDDVIEAWPATLESLKPPLRAAIQEAQPIELEAGVIVFGVPEKRAKTINDRFRKDAELIKQAFEPALGVQPRFKLRNHDFDAHDALRPKDDTGANVPPPDEEEEVDLATLVDAPDAAPPDTVARLVADLGAEIVEERPRD